MQALGFEGLVSPLIPAQAVAARKGRHRLAAFSVLSLSGGLTAETAKAADSSSSGPHLRSAPARQRRKAVEVSIQTHAHFRMLAPDVVGAAGRVRLGASRTFIPGYRAAFPAIDNAAAEDGRVAAWAAAIGSLHSARTQTKSKSDREQRHDE